MRVCYLAIFLALVSSAMTSPTPVILGVVSLVMTMMTPSTGLPYSKSLSLDDGQKRVDVFNSWKIKMKKMKQELENIDDMINNSVNSESSFMDDFPDDDSLFLQVEFPLFTKRVARSPEESGEPGEKAQEMGQKGMGMVSKGMEGGENGGKAASNGANSAKSVAEGLGQGAGMAGSGAETASSGFGKGKEMAGGLSG